MGNAIFRAGRQSAQKFNFENRARRVVEKAERTKPKVAPKHPSTVANIDKIQRDNPKWLEKQYTKDQDLDNMLKGIVVNPDKFGEIKTSTRNLPENRAKGDDPEFGYLEPDYIRPGRCSIRQAIEFIGRHNENPKENTAETLATQYKLNVENMDDTLKHFRTFEFHLPRVLREKLGIADSKKQGQDLMKGGSKAIESGKKSPS